MAMAGCGTPNFLLCSQAMMAHKKKKQETMYEVTFTETFKDGLERLPREIRPIIDRQLDQLAVDPFAKILTRLD